MKFYINKQTGDIAVTTGESITDEYTVLAANTTDAATEKHVPVIKIDNDTVTVDVGSVAHPMTEAHLIAMVALETNYGYHIRKLKYTDAPKAEFKLASGEKAIAAYEYCNLHGLWTAKL